MGKDNGIASSRLPKSPPVYVPPAQMLGPATTKAPAVRPQICSGNAAFSSVIKDIKELETVEEQNVQIGNEIHDQADLPYPYGILYGKIHVTTHEAMKNEILKAYQGEAYQGKELGSKWRSIDPSRQDRIKKLIDDYCSNEEASTQLINKLESDILAELRCRFNPDKPNVIIDNLPETPNRYRLIDSAVQKATFRFIREQKPPLQVQLLVQDVLKNPSYPEDTLPMIHLSDYYSASDPATQTKMLRLAKNLIENYAESFFTGDYAKYDKNFPLGNGNHTQDILNMLPHMLGFGGAGFKEFHPDIQNAIKNYIVKRGGLVPIRDY